MSWLSVYILIGIIWAWIVNSSTEKQFREKEITITNPRARIIAAITYIVAGATWPVSIPVIVLGNLNKYF